MVLTRRVTVTATAATLVLGLAGFVACQLADDGVEEQAGPRIVQPGPPGQPGRTLSPDELSSFSPPAHTIADTQFMQRMISHHEQALAMAGLVASRSQNQDVALLAERIEISQRDEIALMRGWLSERGESTPGPHASHAGPMPGMLAAEQISRLEQAHGTQFDRLFLEFMIYHHQGALVMAQDLYTAGGGLEPTSDRFAREVIADQSIEIRRMQDLLATLVA